MPDKPVQSKTILIIDKETGKLINNRGSDLFVMPHGLKVDDLTFLKIKHRGSDIFIFDTTGKVQTRFGRSGFYGGPTCWYHDLVVDKDENIYIGDILGNTIQKFRKVSR